jgi:hypothetical protein
MERINMNKVMWVLTIANVVGQVLLVIKVGL